MKKLKLALLFVALLFVPSPSVKAQNQTRVLFGAQGGSSFNNLQIGPSVALEVPAGKRLEFDLKENYSPLASHLGLGKGWNNQAYAGGHLWLTRSFGLNANAEYSNYRVTQANKGLYYGFYGVTWRGVAIGAPVRFSFDYIREFNNGISSNGTETSHLQGGQFRMEVRLGCSGPFCYRVDNSFAVGRVLTQGNPVCDGTFGNTGGPNGGPCPRTAASGGSFIMSFLVEFPRRRATENNPF